MREEGEKREFGCGYRSDPGAFVGSRSMGRPGKMTHYPRVVPDGYGYGYKFCKNCKVYPYPYPTRKIAGRVGYTCGYP